MRGVMTSVGSVNTAAGIVSRFLQAFPPGLACRGARPMATSNKAEGYRPRYVDIGINLADPIFRGQYHGTSKHPDDLHAVVRRANKVGCIRLMVTGSSFKSSRDALKLAVKYPGTVYTTAGIHPCSSAIFSTAYAGHHEESEAEAEDAAAGAYTPSCDAHPSDPIPDGDEAIDPVKTDRIISDLRALITEAHSHSHSSSSSSSSSPSPSPPLVAFGEFGLDYDRLHYCPRALQLHSFARQLELAAALDPPLPLFLHSRACHADFVRLLRDQFGARLERLARGGVVHSFTGSADEMRELTADMGLYIGINGCSLKTAENCAVVREVPLDRLMLETDGPWCEVRPSHEGWKYLVEAVARERGDPPAARGVGAVGDEGEGSGAQTPLSQQAQLNQGGGKKTKKKQKNQKKELEVSDRFKVLKKEKWEEGAMVKGRNEPCTIERVATIVAAIKGVPVEVVCEAAWNNTVRVFGLGVEVDVAR